MGGKVGRPRQFQREIRHYRELYESRDLRRVRNNWVLYWRFLAHLEDMGCRPHTINDYYFRLKEVHQMARTQVAAPGAEERR